ncbi:MAG: hypothetical protein AB1715_05945 [Acidobacteriota bacterium]
MRRLGKTPAVEGRRSRRGWLLAILPAVLFPLASRPAPRWWEIVLTLRTAGDYKLDEGDSVFVGHYAFSVRWTGCLEKDDHDYLLYRFDCQVDDWKAEERASRPEATGFVRIEEFGEKPVFNLKYFIRQGKDLHLDFVVERLAFPQFGGEETLPLLLPSSAQNGQREAAVDYNSGVIKGSNRVVLEEEEIYRGPVAKTYAWSWKHQQWLLRQQRTVFASQDHDVEMSLSIIPHEFGDTHLISEFREPVGDKIRIEFGN